MKRWVYLFPGQGSQYVGMCRDFYETYADVRELFEKANEILGMDITRLCFEGPDDVLVQTENVQPAITVANLACHIVLELHEIQPAATAGHSLGEYSALYAAGVIELKDVLRLVQLRGRFMQEAAGVEPGSMAAIMDLEGEKLEEICRLCDTEVANINCPGQVIVTGPSESVQKTMDLSLEAGAKRCIELSVSGPWHSRCMAFAKEKFEPYVRDVVFQDPKIPVVNNVDAKPLEKNDSALGKLIDQICSPVLWHQSMDWFIENGYDHFVEVGPKKILRGLMRRINRKVETHNVEDVATLTSFLQANS